MAITPEQQQRAQTSINVSIALIAVAAGIIAGVFGGFLAISDKIESASSSAIVGIIVLLCIAAVTVSIYFGGTGIKNTSAALASGTLPSNYDKDQFNRQAISGIVGLILGGLGFIWVFTTAGRSKTSTAVGDLAKQMQDLQARVVRVEEDMRNDVHQNMHDLQDRVARLEGDMRTLNSQVSRLVTMQGAPTSPPSLKRPQVHRHQHQRSS
jgi:hypothetical protein